jgi:hypothetical protein
VNLSHPTMEGKERLRKEARAPENSMLNSDGPAKIEQARKSKERLVRVLVIGMI